MSALLQICRTRTAVAVLGSGVVISLTALTGGIAPALAAPHTDPVTPTTTSVEAPALEGAQAPEETDVPEETQAPKVTVAPEVTEAPEVPTPDTTPVETSPVETAAPTVVESPTQTRVADPETATEAPVTTKAPPARTRAPQTEPAPADAPDAPIATTTRPPDLDAPATTTSAVPAADSPPGESQTPQTETAAPDAEVTAWSSSVVTQAALAIQPLKPQTLKAAPADVELAKSAPPVEQQPAPAPEQDVAVLASAIKLGDNDNRSGPAEVGRRDSVVVPARDDRVWDRKVRQWDPDWVRYDEYYRPILSNPYRDPVRIVYVYQNAPRIAIIPALASIVLDVVRLAAYSFTAVLLSPLNAVLDVAVGSFFGGGYIPAVGLPLPPPPPPVLRYDNVPVQVRYSDAVYQPFRVQRIVDVGDDARYGERKVLLDGTTPAWGTWTQTPSGERLFEVHKTQQYPGLDDPRQVPLPGDYQLRLAADDVSTAPGHRTAYLMAAALTCAGLSVSAVIGSVLLGRRRRSEL